MIPTQFHNPGYQSVDLRPFLGTFAEFRRETIAFVTSVLYVRTTAGNILAPTGRLFMKFYWSIFPKSVEKAQAIEIWNTLCEGLCTGVLKSP
jgi:hypothetical protein